MELAAALEVLLFTKTVIVAKQPRCSCNCAKCINLTAAKSVQSLWSHLAKISRNDHILFAFSAICINDILSENADFFLGIVTSTTISFYSAKFYNINVKTVNMTVLLQLLIVSVLTYVPGKLSGWENGCGCYSCSMVSLYHGAIKRIYLQEGGDRKVHDRAYTQTQQPFMFPFTPAVTTKRNLQVFGLWEHPEGSKKHTHTQKLSTAT